jgi:hypothetical protein
VPLFVPNLQPIVAIDASLRLQNLWRNLSDIAMAPGVPPLTVYSHGYGNVTRSPRQLARGETVYRQAERFADLR